MNDLRDEIEVNRNILMEYAGTDSRSTILHSGIFLSSYARALVSEHACSASGCDSGIARDKGDEDEFSDVDFDSVFL